MILLGRHFCKCDSTYQKVPVVGRLDFELWVVQIQNISKCGPKVDFEISYDLESSILKLLGRILCKNVLM